jgi:hypothetical protein
LSDLLIPSHMEQQVPHFTRSLKRNWMKKKFLQRRYVQQ